MMNTLQVVPDKFTQSLNTTALSPTDAPPRGSPGGGLKPRRPTNGLQLKEPVFASLRVRTASGQDVVMVDAGSRQYDAHDNHFRTPDGGIGTQVYTNFLLQGVRQSRNEKSQLIETFGETYVYFHGERPVIYTFSGTLINTFDFNWEAEWEYNYENYLRGTKCVQNNAQVIMAWDDTLVSGYILGFESSKSSEQPGQVPVTFQMFASSIVNVSELGQNEVLPQSIIAKQIKSQSAAAAFLPAQPSSTPLIAGAQLQPTGVIGGVVSTLAGIASSIQSDLSWVQQALSAALTGDIIRVPYGYAGATVYDQEPGFPYVASPWGLGKYTIFQDNYWEYVGQSSYYGNPNASSVPKYMFDDPASQAAAAQDAATDAAAAWSAAGIDPTSSTASVLNSKMLAVATQAVGAGIAAGVPAAVRAL
jgi:hypothetical protein